jgi:lipoate-protein ligase A
MNQNQKPVRLLRLGLTDSWRTQAVYHAVAELMREDSPDTLILCRPREPYLCLGYHQVYEAVLDHELCRRRNLPVFRRQLGGGATYLDSDQLFYQCVVHHTRAPVLFQDLYKRVLRAPVQALRRLGLNAQLRKVNEIEVDGKRIAGTGGARIREACVVVGNLLLDFNYHALPHLWHVPWESFRELAAAALQEHVTTLRRLNAGVTAETLEPLLLDHFAEALGNRLQEGGLSSEEELRSRDIAARMASDAYLHLHRDEDPAQPMNSLKISADVSIRAHALERSGYTLRASFRIQDGVIQESRLDSSPIRSWGQAEEALRGADFSQWENKLRTLIA